MRRGEAMPRFQGEKTVVKREKQNTNNSLIPIKNIYIHYHEFKKNTNNSLSRGGKWHDLSQSMDRAV